MKIRTSNTFEQKFREKSEPRNKFSVDFLKLEKNKVYHVFFVPKILFLDLEKGEAEIEYPFEKVYTHFGTYDFMLEYAKMKSVRINCAGCSIDEYLQENRVPKSVFKICVPTEFYLSYVVHDRRIKLIWLQDYLYNRLVEKIGTVLKEKEMSLIDVFRHRVKIYTNEEKQLDADIDLEVEIPQDSTGLKNVYSQVYAKPLDQVIEFSVITEKEKIDSVCEAIKEYAGKVIDYESKRNEREKMAEKTKKHEETIKSMSENLSPPEEENPIFSDEELADGPF